QRVARWILSCCLRSLRMVQLIWIIRMEPTRAMTSAPAIAASSIATPSGRSNWAEKYSKPAVWLFWITKISSSTSTIAPRIREIHSPAVLPPLLGSTGAVPGASGAGSPVGRVPVPSGPGRLVAASSGTPGGVRAPGAAGREGAGEEGRRRGSVRRGRGGAGARGGGLGGGSRRRPDDPWARSWLFAWGRDAVRTTVGPGGAVEPRTTRTGARSASTTGSGKPSRRAMTVSTALRVRAWKG